VPDIRVAIVGYGLSGRYFHAPLIAATAGLELSYVVTASGTRAQAITQEHPGARAIRSVNDLWEQAPPPELLVVATPNDSHVGIALSAVGRGIPVVVDKPLAPMVADAEALVSRAERAGVLLTVFHNRRWDTEQLTLRRLIANGALGTVTRYESRFERWRPEADRESWRETAPPQAGGGVLLDLGSHLADQALVLFGPATHVYAELHNRRGDPGDDDMFVALRHASGTISHLWASVVAPSPGPRLRVQGTAGGFLVASLDPQEGVLRAGGRPHPGKPWGKPPEWAHGRLVAGEQSVPVTPEPGDWPRFYTLLRDALRGGGPLPVEPRDAVEALRVLEAARQSAPTPSVIAL
jgi:predicted dehydrogenase